MIIIGVTGGSGSGKGEVAKVFENNGYYNIDTDLDAKSVVKKGSKCLKEIENCFLDVVLENGELNRKALAKIVFNNNEEMNKLNSIIHKYITIRVINKIKTLKKKGIDKVIIDGAALFESGINKKCLKVIAVVASGKNRLDRIMKRDNLTIEQAKMRINGQKSDEFFTKNADFVIINDKDINNLNKKTNDIINHIKKDYLK